MLVGKRDVRQSEADIIHKVEAQAQNQVGGQDDLEVGEDRFVFIIIGPFHKNSKIFRLYISISQNTAHKKRAVPLLISIST